MTDKENRQKTVEALNNLGKACNDAGDFDGAIRACMEIAKISPEASAMAYQNIGKTFGEMGRIPEAISYYYKALEINPASASARSDLLLTLNYANMSREVMFFEHCKFDSVKIRSPQSLWRSDFHNTRPRIINIGYVSADFREHPVAHLFLPVIRNHDKAKFKIFLYSNNEIQDAITEKIKKHTDEWRDVAKASDDQIYEMIKKDEIDILVDLSGHTGGNRLMVFAQKPAPVQTAWLGYMNTTGLRSMDYRITDEALAPEGSDIFYTEKLVRVPDSFCFDPIQNPPKAVDLPALKNGLVTFASLNNYKKINDKVLDVWTAILKAVPKSRLIISVKGSIPFQDSVREKFALRGIEAGRIVIVDLMPMEKFLELWNKTDIALDPFPFSGCITVYHGLSAGVPSLTLEGNSEYERNGSVVMRKAGLADFVATSQKDYIEKAVFWANNLEKLQALRKTLPESCRKNLEKEEKEVTKGIENAFSSFGS